jgi:putative hydrolase of the HAD superfamily
MTLSRLNPNALKNRPDGVLFDTDNTLYAYPPAHAAGMNAVRQKAERVFNIGAPKFDAAFAKAREAVKARLKGTASSHSRLLYFQQLLEILGLGSQVMLALDFEQTYWRTFLSSARLFDGVKEFFDDLRIAGIPTAVVTDLTAQIQFRKIIYFGLDHYCDYIVTSEEAGADKPHRAPFELAVQKMNLSGKRVWMIGDNAVADIRGARETIGAVTIQKLHDGVDVGRGTEQPDATVDRFDDLRGVLRDVTRGAAQGV